MNPVLLREIIPKIGIFLDKPIQLEGLKIRLTIFIKHLKLVVILIIYLKRVALAISLQLQPVISIRTCSAYIYRPCQTALFAYK